MGNKIARTTQVSASEYYLHDLPSSYNLVLKEVLGRGRFLKSILCKHDEGLVLVKVYFKRGDSIDLREYERRLFQIKEIFRTLDNPHVWPFQFWQETDKAAYLLRQYFFNNLHDRLSTRPFLSPVEKKWLAFQLLLAVKQSHEKGVCHGDIKCENVLVTSWNWLYLADFASFKPTYIPYDDPSDFSFFFDTGGRRLCYLAPERFYEHGGEMQVAQDATLRPSMDIFAVGCVIAELFLEGQPLFELSQLLSYRRGQFDPSQHLEKIPDSGIRKMILHMIQLEPESRLSAESYLQEYAAVVFPSYFSPFLHNFYCYLNPRHSDVALCQRVFQEILKQMMNNRSSEETSTGLATPSKSTSGELLQEMVAKQNISLTKDSLRKREQTEKGLIHDQFELIGDLNTLLRDVKPNNHYPVAKPMLEDAPDSAFSQNLKSYEIQSPGDLLQTISNAFKRNDHPFLKKITMNDLNTLMSEYDSQSDTFGMPFLPLPEDSMRCEGMVLIASLLCSCIRNVKLPHLRRAAILLLKSSALYIDDEDRLQRVLPYVIAMLSDPAAIVRCAALETLCDILPLVRDFPPSDAKIFPVYILPMLSMLPDDPEESVRICYASNISKLALTAYGFLIHSISMSEAGVLDELTLAQKPFASSNEASERLQRINSDAQLAQLRKSIAEVVQELVMGPKQTPNIRRALLQDIGNLCCFFGQRQSNDFLLPILPAFLNDRDEQLRAVFYGQIVYVCFFVGQRSVEEYLLPYIEQALSDATEAVIVNAFECLAVLCRRGFLRKRILLEMIERAFPLLCYPSRWVRRSAVTFIAASSESLGAVDSYVFLAPFIRPFLRRQPASLASEKALLSCLNPPFTRQECYQVLENARSSDMLERQRKIWYNSSPHSKQWENMDLLNRGSIKNWPDNQQIPEAQTPVDKALQQPELTESDDGEAKLRGMGNFMRNAASTVDIRDPLSSEKLKFSGFMSPQVSGVSSFMCDKSAEGIPLYSFSLDRRAVGIPPAASDSPLQANSPGIGSSSMPWMDPVNKSFSLASSVPEPKLVSGSYSISNGSKQFHRVVHEPDGNDNDQMAYANTISLEIGSSGMMKGSSITVDDASTSTDLLGLPTFARTSSIPDSVWRPRGVLVAHLQEHRSAVNDIAVTTDHSFFVSASDDSTVKVWDSRKLEKDISFRSRLTYHLEGSRALCAAMLRGSAQVIVGACDGMIHMFSVDYVSSRKYLKDQQLKKLEEKNNNQNDEAAVSDEDEEEDGLRVDEAKVDESKQMDFAKVEKRVRTTGGGSTGTVRNLRIREDTAKYLLNLDVNSAHYDPKTRSMREDPLPDADPNEKFYGGDNQHRNSGEALEFNQLNIHSWEAFDKGQDIHMQAAPSQAELLYKNYKVIKEKLKFQTKDTILEKYGNAAAEEELPMELLLGQSERQVEYDRAGRIIKGQEKAIPRSKYEEDVHINNHTYVWGSWWKDHQWGYKCCKQMIRNSYCTGAAGIEAAEAATDLMKANIARKEATEELSSPVEAKRLATWGTDIPDDLVLDDKLLAEALKKEDEKRREERDERKRKYNVRWNDEVTIEDMEAYRMKKVHHDDPMKDFLH